ncbi:hypothetical protein JYU34_022298 [Plutella xylostella]|uniref:DAC domain-containing protein n=1 Tax=Plutella xylostella TaxID=51655 RepID=A0ABQ7PR70_PLUXY|nr:hypothetical protein JYU34_022298 [Plutella xylostella]
MKMDTRSTAINIVDLSCLTVLIVVILLRNRGTKTIQIIKGVFIICLVKILSSLLGLKIITALIEDLTSNLNIVLLIIFQLEIRKGLELIGRGNFCSKMRLTGNETDYILAYDKALQYMAKRKIGALITIERQTNLDEFIETGLRLKADLTAELLINIFIPNTPLHDGAVIIRNGKIEVTCAYLPLSTSDSLSKEFGTRHRAALGISEASDAITLVISEETGDVSLACDGRLLNNLTREQYLSFLTEKLAGEKVRGKNFLKFRNLFRKEHGIVAL